MSSNEFDKWVKIRQDCLGHAEDLLNSAKIIARSNMFNIAYHLTVLALEEIGKGEMVIVAQTHPVAAKGQKFSKILEEDHEKKLFWALWVPSNNLTSLSKESVDEFQKIIDFSKSIHAQRIRGLYVNLSGNQPKPAEVVSKESAESLLGLAETRLNLARTRELREMSGDERAAFDWALTTDDKEKRNFMYSKKSLEKLRELGDSAKWIIWLKDEYARNEAECKKLLQAELNKSEPNPSEKYESKWKIRYKLVTPSHTIKDKDLKDWNEKILYQKFYSGKREGALSTLIVDQYLPKGVHIKALWNAGWGEARMHTIALNIATHGFFWWHMPKDVSKYYEEIHDLEHNTLVQLERSPKLMINWGSEALEWRHLQNAAMCYRFLPRNNEKFLSAYVTGVSFMAKSDIHTQFESQIFISFYNGLIAAIEFYKERDFQIPIEQDLEKICSQFLNQGSTLIRDYSQLAKGALSEAPNQSPKITLLECGMMKIIFDLYVMKKIFEIAKHDESMAQLVPPEPI